MSILSLNNVSLHLAENCILDGVSFQIEAKDRIAIVGRNGAGKSTLLKLLQGQVIPDKGQIHQQNGLRVAGLTQDVPVSQDETVYHFLVKSLGPAGVVLAQYREFANAADLDNMAHCQQQIDSLHAWDLLPKIETMASRLDLPSDALMNSLSGGMRRRVLLGAALLAEPDLLLLDEPTNHLDITAIEWLESWLRTYPGSLLVVTHDRQFLAQVANRIVEIDRGQLHSHLCDYPTYLDRREAIRLTEQKENSLFDKELKEEEAWLRQGVKARRTRNEGRVRRLKALREEYRQRREQLGKVRTISLDVAYSGKVVIAAEKVNYQVNQRQLIRDFSLLLSRGDKLGIIGPNGCGKTTLIRLLLGELTPQSGSIHQGTGLQVAYFEQLRHQLDEQKSVMFNVADGADFVTINGQNKHVASYLRDFLFYPEQFNQPVRSLSGGERNRLLLAKLLARPANLLVMDEPTNDLDIETLELLESLLIDYPGTLLLISHDREFINQVVNSVLVYEGDGCFNEFVGGYEDYLRFKKQQQQEAAPKAKAASLVTRCLPVARVTLTSAEQRELNVLPKQIEKLEKQIAAIHVEMAHVDFYQGDASQVKRTTEQLAQHEVALRQFYVRWEELEGKADGINN